LKGLKTTLPLLSSQLSASWDSLLEAHFRISSEVVGHPGTSPAVLQI